LFAILPDADPVPLGIHRLIKQGYTKPKRKRPKLTPEELAERAPNRAEADAGVEDAQGDEQP
jgi:hypothetical protein